MVAVAVAVVLVEAAAPGAVDLGLAVVPVPAPAVVPHPVLQPEARHAVVLARLAHMAVAITAAVPQYRTVPDLGHLRV